jgi:hypothetical protein
VKLAAAALLVLALPAQAQMYKCVDEQGKVNYRDQSGPGCKPVDIRASSPISGKAAAAPTPSYVEQDAQIRRRLLEREQTADAERRARDALTRRCAGLRQEHAVLTSGRRIVEFTAQGDRVFMDDAVRERRLAQVTQELRSCP